MVVLGIDPGMALMGYGVVSGDNNRLKVIDYGVTKTEANIDTPQRLLAIFNSIEQLIEKYQPDAIAIEELFFNKNVKTALTIGHARGVIVLAGARSNADLYEYTP